MSILVNAGDGNSIFDIAAKFQNMELREMKKQPDTIKSNRKAGLDTGSSDFNTKLGDIEAMFSQLNYKIETINTRRPAPQYLITISQSIPNIILNINKEVNALVKASKSKATKWATELSDDDKDDIRFNMDNLTTIKNNLKESGQMSDFKTQYKKLTELVEKDLEPIVQRLTGKSYTKPQAQPAGPAGQAGPMTPSPRRRQSPNFSTPGSDGSFSGSPRAPPSTIRGFHIRLMDATRGISIDANGEKIVSKKTTQAVRELMALAREVNQAKSDRYQYSFENAVGTALTNDVRKRDEDEFDGYLQAILSESRGTSGTSGAGKYSSQAKHYLSQDYYTFVDTMPKKRFL